MARLMSPLRKNGLFYLWLALLAALIALGGYGYYMDRTHELSGMNNVVPWGLGIVIDISAIAIAAGSFTLAALVYVFRRTEFEPLVPVAVLIGLLGYSAAGLALLTDLGRPDRFWHILVYLNSHSVLSVVAWCLLLFTASLFLMLVPIIRRADFGRRLPLLGSISDLLVKVMPAVVLAGALFSLTHQGAAGATFGVVKSRAVWFKPTLPLVFTATAIFAGLGFTLMMVVVTERVTGMRRRLINRAALVKAARIAGMVGIVTLFVRLWEQVFTSYFSPNLFFQQQADLLGSETPFTLGVVVGEFALGTIIPTIIFLSPQAPVQGRNLVLAGGLATMGLLVNRWDTTLSGLVASVSYSPSTPSVVFNPYFPSWVEWLIALGILAFAALGYSLGVRILPIFRPEPQ